MLNITFGTSALAAGVAPSSVSDNGEIVDTAPEGFVRDDDGGLVQIYRGGEAVPESVLHHGGEVVEDPSIHLVWIGGRPRMRADLEMAREFSSWERLSVLDRYGVRATGLRVTGTQLPSIGMKVNDLDIQRALSRAVDEGRLQHVNAGAIYVVMMEPGVDLSIGTTTDFTSYNSVFHPTEKPMRYVVVRGGLDENVTRAAMYAGVARAAINPNGNGWF